MFEGLKERLGGVFRELKSRGVLGEEQVDSALREIRLALLEADVNFRVAKEFAAKIREDLVGAERAAHLDPSQQVVRAVQGRLVELMGARSAPLARAARGVTTLLLVGLQGSGKTTTAGKLALRLRSGGLRVLLAPADAARPAAVEQLERLAARAGADSFDSGGMSNPVEIVRLAAERARSEHFDYCIVDTAGRLHADDELMDELKRMKEAARPDETLLVADAMTGQEAVNLGRAFAGRIGITGVVLTKLDGDARGGGALSLRAATGVPVKLVGVGEKIDALEEFHPERMASRVLGMGDVMSLIEKAEAALSADGARSMAESMGGGSFTLETMKEQILQMRKMGSVGEVMSMIPGLGARMPDADIDEAELSRAVAIIDSMTPAERGRPDIIKGSRRRRIAAGSGTRVQDVNRLLRRFSQTRKLMKRLSGSGGKKQMRRMRQMINF